MDNSRKLFLSQQTFATLFSLANKLQVTSNVYLKNFTMRQLMVMIAIIHLPEDEASLNNIARKLGTSKQTVKQLVSLIERNGYVVTAPSRRDKRAVNVTITPPGKQALLEDNELGLKFFDQLFHDFSLEEMEVLWNLLKKLYRFDGQEQDGFEEEINYQ